MVACALLVLMFAGLWWAKSAGIGSEPDTNVALAPAAVTNQAAAAALSRSGLAGEAMLGPILAAGPKSSGSEVAQVLAKSSSSAAVVRTPAQKLIAILGAGPLAPAPPAGSLLPGFGGFFGG
jgi:hypothetical protein